MFLTMKVKSYSISAETEKEAYIKGCKQLASVLASKKFTNLSFKIERTKEENTFNFVIYTNIDLGAEQKEFCKVCKEFHCSFFINEDYNCSRCNMKALLRKAEERARVSKAFYKERLKD